ncbi:MAG TPA: ricin-type beta-trefoil lectin domain protein [Candidatus Saccharimonadales bacterium]|nr:ricin-type beta-trefoil lectin domain protein [Candidatus Saccharimonadales bacterium]
MYVRPNIVAHNRRTSSQLTDRPNHSLLWVVSLIFAVFIIWAVGLFSGIKVHAATQEIKSGFSGYCIDQSGVGGVSLKKCSDNDSQNWYVNQFNIIHDKTCLGVANGGTSPRSTVVVRACDDSAGQVWLRDNNGYENPNSGLCLSAQGTNSTKPLVIASCDPSNQSEQWSPVLSNGDSYNQSCNSGSEGQRVACFAGLEWTHWQSGNPSHNDLLNIYSDGNGYEEWCADFVSYVYKEAGYSFTQGERNGWDEYSANNIQNLGFTEHDPSNYTPKPGDIAYFNYSSGHVEIVVSGGTKPTFVYGDSATIDPATGNGDMEANTITNEGSSGQLQYYLSPNQ